MWSEIKMDKKGLAIIFALACYMIGAFFIPAYLAVEYLLWLATINYIVYLINSIPLGILLGFWFWISLGIFAYVIDGE